MKGGSGERSCDREISVITISAQMGSMGTLLVPYQMGVAPVQPGYMPAVSGGVRHEETGCH